MSLWLQSCVNSFSPNCDFQSVNQVIILHMSWQLSCHGMCKIRTWSDNYFSCKKSLKYFYKDLNNELINPLRNGPKAYWFIINGEVRHPLHVTYSVWLSHNNHLCVKLLGGNTKVYLHSVSFLQTEMTQMVEVLYHRRQGHVNRVQAIPWLLMTWRHQEPGHQQPWYELSSEYSSLSAYRVRWW